jgi:hypothetical protein
MVFYDVQGQIILSEFNIDPVKNKFDYDLSSKASGIYFVKIFSGTDTLCFKKILKQ